MRILPSLLPRRPGVAAVLAGLLLALPLVAQGNVRLPGLDGGQLTSGDLASGSTIVVVWSTWSPRCRDIVPRVNSLAGQWGGRARVVTVNFQEEPAAVRKFLEGKSLSAPVYLDRDGEFAKAHAVTTLPGLVVFRDGAARYQGKLPADPDAVLNDALR
jgi:thiol-disulfide isomerase/thioredoxin